MNYVYTTNDPAKYGDTKNNIANMILSGLEIHEGGNIKEWNLGATAEIIPRLHGGNLTQYKCNWHYAGNKDTTLRTLLLGGRLNAGTKAGLGYFDSSGSGEGYVYPFVGFRSVLVV